MLTTCDDEKYMCLFLTKTKYFVILHFSFQFNPKLIILIIRWTI